MDNTQQHLTGMYQGTITRGCPGLQLLTVTRLPDLKQLLLRPTRGSVLPPSQAFPSNNISLCIITPSTLACCPPSCRHEPRAAAEWTCVVCVRCVRVSVGNEAVNKQSLFLTLAMCPLMLPRLDCTQIVADWSHSPPPPLLLLHHLALAGLASFSGSSSLQGILMKVRASLSWHAVMARRGMKFRTVHGLHGGTILLSLRACPHPTLQALHMRCWGTRLRCSTCARSGHSSSPLVTRTWQRHAGTMTRRRGTMERRHEAGSHPCFTAHARPPPVLPHHAPIHEAWHPASTQGLHSKPTSTQAHRHQPTSTLLCTRCAGRPSSRCWRCCSPCARGCPSPPCRWTLGP